MTNQHTHHPPTQHLQRLPQHLPAARGLGTRSGQQPPAWPGPHGLSPAAHCGGVGSPRLSSSSKLWSWNKFVKKEKKNDTESRRPPRLCLALPGSAPPQPRRAYSVSAASSSSALAPRRCFPGWRRLLLLQFPLLPSSHFLFPAPGGSGTGSAPPRREGPRRRLRERRFARGLRGSEPLRRSRILLDLLPRQFLSAAQKKKKMHHQ